MTTQPDKITLTRPDDWHLHLRDGTQLAAVLPDTARQFARAIVMPNLVPPVTSVASAAAYRDRILAALPKGMRFDPLVTLYLTEATTPADIAEAKASGFVHAVKYYPSGATTNSEAGVRDLANCKATLAAMMDQIARCAAETLARGAVTPSQIDRLVMVGGSSLLSSLEAALCQLCPNAQIENHNAMTAVADGLALSAAGAFA